MSNREQFYSGKVPVGGVLWMPNSRDYATDGGLFSEDGRDYLRSGHLITYDPVKHSALIGTGLDQYTRSINAQWNYKVMVNGVYEWWYRAPLASHANINRLCVYYRPDANGFLQLVGRDPDPYVLLQTLTGTPYFTIYGASETGIMDGGRKWIKVFVLGLTRYAGATPESYHRIFVCTSDDGFNWKAQEKIFTYGVWSNAAYVVPSYMGSMNYSRCPANDNYFVFQYNYTSGSIGTYALVFDKWGNCVFDNVIISTGTSYQDWGVVGPDGFMVGECVGGTSQSSGYGYAVFLNFSTWEYNAVGQMGYCNHNKMDVSESTWVFGYGQVYYVKQVGEPYTAFAATQQYLGLSASNGNACFVRYMPNNTWWAASDGGSAPNISYFSGARVVAASTFTTQTSSVQQVQFIQTTHHDSGSYLMQAKFTNGTITTSGSFIPKQSGAFTALFCCGTNTYTYTALSVFAYMGGAYYSYMEYGTRLLMFSSTDLRTWTYLAEQAIVSDRVVIFKVVNGILFVGDGTTLWSTTDGITLTARTTGLTSVYDIDYFAGTYIAAGAHASKTHSTAATLGGTWTTAQLGAGTVAYRVCNNGTTAVMTTNDATSKLYYSTNATAWNSLAYTTKSVGQILYDGTKFVAVDGTTLATAQSTTGQASWTTNTPNSTGTSYTSNVFTYPHPINFVYADGVYFLCQPAVSVGSPSVMKTTDLISWSGVVRSNVGGPGRSYQATYAYRLKPTRIVSMANGRVFVSGPQGLMDMGEINVHEVARATPVAVGSPQPITDSAEGVIGYVRIK